MSLLVAEMDYNQAIRSIREIVLDTSPVQCFKVSGQDFLFKKESNSFTLSDSTFSTGEAEKFYDLMDKIRAKSVTIGILGDFVPTEYTSNIVDFNYPSLSEIKTVSRDRYFSLETIEGFIEEYFAYYLTFTDSPRTLEQIFNELDYFQRKKLVFWVSYYLIDKKRMNYASTGEMIRLNNPEDLDDQVSGAGGQLKNIDETVTTKVGEVFTVTEKISEGGQGVKGFTSLWGDKYDYFTKLQLYIRDRFERQFRDYSLRDDAMITQEFGIEKGWEDSSWIDPNLFSNYTSSILNPDR